MAFSIKSVVTPSILMRSLQKSSNELVRSLERLSSGLRINRAQDDPAGLKISTSLTAQSRGLEVGRRDTLQGMSMVETAESALSRQTTMIQRIRELALQAANGSQSDNDRLALDAEAKDLITEVGRVARAAQFNRLPLLTGTLGPVMLQVGPNPGDTFALQFDRAATILALGLVGGKLGPPTYDATGSGVESSFVSGDLRIDGALAGSQGDAAHIAAAINGLNPSYGASASNAVSGVAFTAVTGVAAAVATPTTLTQTGAYVAAVSDGVAAVPIHATMSGAYVAAASDGGGTTTTGPSGTFDDVVPPGDLSWQFQFSVDSVSVIDPTSSTVTAADMDAALATKAGALSALGITFTGTVAGGDLVFQKVGGTDLQISAVTTSGASSNPGAGFGQAAFGAAAFDESATGNTFAAQPDPFTLQVDGSTVFTKSGGVGQSVSTSELDTAFATFATASAGAYTFTGSFSDRTARLEKAAATPMVVGITSNYSGTPGVLPGFTGTFNNAVAAVPGTTPFTLTVDGTTAFTKAAEAGATVSAAEIDVALGAFASGSAGAYSYTGSVALGTAQMAKADGTSLSVQISSNFATTPGQIPGLVGSSSNGTPVGTVSAPDYQMSVNGTALSLTGAASDGTITLSEMAAAINAKVTSTGVGATVSGAALSLSSSDGRNISLVQSGAAAASGGLAGGAGTTTYRGTVKLVSELPFTIGGTAPDHAGLTAGSPAASYLLYNSVSLRTADGAGVAIRVADAALDIVSNHRGYFGASLNRLQFAAETLEQARVATDQANSRIRDADVAVEYANATKAKILQNAGVALLAQANVNDRVALALLR
ncbi:flagellin [Curvibacter sp. APW13]|uniref:flagellin N-terminal helical domain-containing protein n=1 Tax=Curvibacter sp. APW13 TaxID=3077236 RepID=UPI0028DECABF|nr:flagellin [Curvibacter sp. APW13]MDT8991503.1 flagellin [Curvibacter sp. APW13]